MKLEIEGAELDLELAVLRLRADLRDDWFPDPLRFADLLQPEAVARHFEQGYAPQGAVEVNVPKSGFTLRYSLEQAISDRIAYQAMADSLERLDDALAPNVYGYRIRSGRAAQMFFSKVQAWIDFNNTIRVRSKDRGATLLVTDVQNFYEGIWHKDLLADIERLGMNTHAQRRLLGRMLATWSRYDGVALPQNRDASSFFANIYLQHIDSDMLDRGYDYFRYMDDIRVVCKDRFEARRALLDLIGSLRHRHLNVNANKTHIFNWNEDAKLDEYVPAPDLDVERFDTALRSRLGADNQTIALMKTKLEKLISEREFGERSFRACLERVKRVANSPEGQHLDFSAINDGIVAAIGDYPWLTEYMVTFLRHSSMKSNHIEQLAKIVLEPDTYIYPSQAYLIWQLLAAVRARTRDLRLSAQLQATAGSEPVRAAGALIYLGACGTDEDRIRVAREIGQLPENRLIRRAAVLATQELGGMYVDRYFASLKPEDVQLREYVRAKSAPTYVEDLPKRRLSHLNIDLPDDY